MSDPTISNVMAIRADMIARSRALREAQPNMAPAQCWRPSSSFAQTLDVVAKVNETQQREDVATEAYERGETNDIATVALIRTMQVSRSKRRFRSTTNFCPHTKTS
jgi:flagellar hook-basal body complex protein FliE